MGAGFTIWGLHPKVGFWLDIETGLSGNDAVVALTTRQDRVRRTRQTCQFKVLPDGEVPSPHPPRLRNGLPWPSD
jgi:hypothetical protein